MLPCPGRQKGGISVNKVAIVTGASKGIGQGCAEAFLDAGFVVVGCSRNAPADEAITGNPAYHHRICDVSNPAQVRDLIEWTAKTLGRIDTLVNNAGVHPPFRPIDDLSLEDFRALLETNLVSMFVASKHALPHLRRTRGSIVNITSLVGVIGQEQAVDYCSTKAGIIGMTKALAIDEAPNGVRVNSVAPGAVLTPLAESLNSPKRLETIGGWAWMQRLGTSREVGDLVVFLASDQASFLTGQNIVIDGGAGLGYGLKASTYYQVMAETDG